VPLQPSKQLLKLRHIDLIQLVWRKPSALSQSLTKKISVKNHERQIMSITMQTASSKPSSIAFGPSTSSQLEHKWNFTFESSKKRCRQPIACIITDTQDDLPLICLELLCRVYARFIRATRDHFSKQASERCLPLSMMERDHEKIASTTDFLWTLSQGNIDKQQHLRAPNDGFYNASLSCHFSAQMLVSLLEFINIFRAEFELC
jgi:hypothetical protein